MKIQPKLVANHPTINTQKKLHAIFVGELKEFQWHDLAPGLPADPLVECLFKTPTTSTGKTFIEVKNRRPWGKAYVDIWLQH